MARTTKKTETLARIVGVNPSRLQAWQESGLLPAGDVDRSTFLAHCRALEAVTGRGRDRAVAVIKMADQGFACRDLREVLLQVRTEDGGDEPLESADDAVSYFTEAEHLAPIRQSIMGWAAEAPSPSEYKQLPAEPDLPAIRSGAAVRSIFDGVSDTEVGPDDFSDLDEIVSVPMSRLAEENVPYDRELLEVLPQMFEFVKQEVLKAPETIETAALSDLIVGVQAAKRKVDALAVEGIVFPGDEDRWRLIGQMAPSAARVLKPLELLIINSYLPMASGRTIPDGEKAFFEALTGQAITDSNSTAELAELTETEKNPT